MMKVELVNDGPVTMLLDSRKTIVLIALLFFDDASRGLLRWKRARDARTFCLAWMWVHRACAPRSSTCTGGRSLRRRADRDGLSAADLGRAAAPGLVGRGRGRREVRDDQAEASSPNRSLPSGLDCTACTVVACDAQGEPLRGALLWMDQRAFREAGEISATGDPVLRYVSGRVSPEWMLPRRSGSSETSPRSTRMPRGSSRAPTG